METQHSVHFLNQSITERVCILVKILNDYILKLNLQKIKNCVHMLIPVVVFWISNFEVVISLKIHIPLLLFFSILYIALMHDTMLHI